MTGTITRTKSGKLRYRNRFTVGLTEYTVEVRYRTNSSCNSKLVPVKAVDMEDAIRIATGIVRKQRGVIRIDGGSVS